MHYVRVPSVRVIVLSMVVAFSVMAERASAQVIDRATRQVQGGAGSLSLDASALIELGIDPGPMTGETAGIGLVVTPESDLACITVDAEFRHRLPGSVDLMLDTPLMTPDGRLALSGHLRLEPNESFGDQPFEYFVRDIETGHVVFEVYWADWQFDAGTDQLAFSASGIAVSSDFALALGRPELVGRLIGAIGINTMTTVIERQRIDQGTGETVDAEMPGTEFDPRGGFPGQTTGPDVIVGVIPAVSMPSSGIGGRTGSVVGLGVATTSCNKGNVNLNWFQMPNTDHPVIPQNCYRLKDDRIEQVGQSWLKHAFAALAENACGWGCNNPGTQTLLGVGCSDPYSSSLNYGQSGLGARGWVNPWTGAYPNTARNHSGHTHIAISHRLQVDDADLNPAVNPGAVWYFEAQYVTPHEYQHALANNYAGNMDNNVSYRQFTPVYNSGTLRYTFTTVGSTIQEQPAIRAWTGATFQTIQPATSGGSGPAPDGKYIIAYKVTGPVSGLYHYEYAIYNQNLDRSIRQFSMPGGSCAGLTNIGFRHPLNHAAEQNDGTQNSQGYSNTPWSDPNPSDGVIEWSTQTFSQNQNANALRWGTMYNFRFDSPRPPVAVQATVGYFKTGSPSTVTVQGPSPVMPGDMNGDNQVDSSDVPVYVSILLGQTVPTAAQLCAGDTDGSGVIDGDDIGSFSAMLQ